MSETGSAQKRQTGRRAQGMSSFRGSNSGISRPGGSGVTWDDAPPVFSTDPPSGNRGLPKGGLTGNRTPPSENRGPPSGNRGPSSGSREPISLYSPSGSRTTSSSYPPIGGRVTKPRIDVRQAMPLMIREGDADSVTVEVSGAPAPGVKWYLGRNELQHCDDFKIKRVGFLHSLWLKNVAYDINELGITVTAQNIHGFDTKDLSVKVYRVLPGRRIGQRSRSQAWQRPESVVLQRRRKIRVLRQGQSLCSVGSISSLPDRSSAKRSPLWAANQSTDDVFLERSPSGPTSPDSSFYTHETSTYLESGNTSFYDMDEDPLASSSLQGRGCRSVEDVLRERERSPETPPQYWGSAQTHGTIDSGFESRNSRQSSKRFSSVDNVSTEVRPPQISPISIDESFAEADDETSLNTSYSLSVIPGAEMKPPKKKHRKSRSKSRSKKSKSSTPKRSLSESALVHISETLTPEPNTTDPSQDVMSSEQLPMIAPAVQLEDKENYVPGAIKRPYPVKSMLEPHYENDSAVGALWEVCDGVKLSDFCKGALVEFDLEMTKDASRESYDETVPEKKRRVSLEEALQGEANDLHDMCSEITREMTARTEDLTTTYTESNIDTPEQETFDRPDDDSALKSTEPMEEEPMLIEPDGEDNVPVTTDGTIVVIAESDIKKEKRKKKKVPTATLR